MNPHLFTDLADSEESSGFPENAAKRQQIMAELLGRKIPKSQAGVTALEKLCKESLGMTPYYKGCHLTGQYYSCSAVEERFVTWLLEGISTPTNTQPAQQEIEALRSTH